MEIIAQSNVNSNNNMEIETTTAEVQLEPAELKLEQDLLLVPEQKQHNNNQINIGLNFQACDASSDPASAPGPEKKLDEIFDSMMTSMCTRSNWKAEVDSETETVTDIQIKNDSDDQPPGMEAALKWKSHLDHVENRLFEFEKEIQEHEATLASTLSNCEILLEKLSQVPDPGPNSNPNSTDPQDDESDEGVGAVDANNVANDGIRDSDITETEEVVLNIWKNQKRSQSQSRSPRIFTSTFAAPDSGSNLETSDLAAGENHLQTQPGGKILCESCGSLFKNVSDYNTHFEKCGTQKNHYDETDKDHSQQ